MKPLFYSLLFIAMTSCCCPQQDKCVVPQQFTAASDFESPGFDSKRLDRVDSLMAGYVREGVIPNAVSFVARNGRIVHNRAYGYRDAGANIPVTTTDIFRWASQTKAITTVVLLTLFEENMFLLDDPIEKFLPVFAHPKVYVSGSAEKGDLVTRPAVRRIIISERITIDSSVVCFGPWDWW
jgi:CubicO group peptidase (beta-lactamase class C family)